MGHEESMMRIFQRMNDILCANIHDMIDRFEDPEVMLKQAIREMEESIQQVTLETSKAIAGDKRLARELAKNEAEALQWQHRATQAVQNGDDQLARKALERKNESQCLIKALREQSEAVGKAVQTLKDQLAAMNAKMAEAKRQLAGLLIRKKAADIRTQTNVCLDPKVTAPFSSNAFRKFDRLREKVEQAEAEADALTELNALCSLGELGQAVGDAPIAETFADMKIEEELACMKSEIKRPQ
jgi:phage shock protein A